MTDTPDIPLYARINGAVAWKPAKDRTEDEVLTGTLVTVQSRTTEYGTYPVVVIDTGEPSLAAFHAFHHIALDQLMQLKPSDGERITIVAHPKRASKKRKDANGDPVKYNQYTIFNPDEVKDVQSANWDFFAPDQEGPDF